MTSSVEVELARLTDRDQVLEALATEGLEARLVEDEARIAIEVLGNGDPDTVQHDLLLVLESWVATRELPLVPVPGRQSIMLRPAAE